MLTVLIFSIPLLMGGVCGLRSMTGPAILCWTAHLGGLQLNGTRLAFLVHPISLGVFTLLALGELVADKLPFIPRRTMIGPLLVRVLSGGFCGLVLGLSMNTPLIVSALLGGVGALIAAFAGYHLPPLADSRPRAAGSSDCIARRSGCNRIGPLCRFRRISARTHHLCGFPLRRMPFARHPNSRR